MIIFFYLFATLLIISSICVVTSKNSVYSILWLIFSFCNGSGLMILLGAEFLAMMLIVIYVGAVAVLFLFVIMMLDIHLSYAIVQLKRNLFITILISLLIFIDFVLIILLSTKYINLDHSKIFAISPQISNTHSIGKIFYTDFILPFQISGLILFVSMISCITLTIRHRTGVKRQNIIKQNAKNRDNAILIVNPNIREGVKEIKYD